ncbi:hypothetical protein [Muriicola sp. Z0-33]|uniref:hypothetical protein n=1 Tax=Muriicola sp. Z0-33 TaxID=2816957 RepID=UPI00223700E6|nr:hypothetical protein [Muriicola sp. Z0-33]MCW5514657.1 hypothetical protein [Muriicola sp. Z0-33]
MKSYITGSKQTMILLVVILISFTNNSYPNRWFTVNCDNALSVVSTDCGKANSSIGQLADKVLISIESNGFNSKKRSRFSVNGITEYTTRGLTIVHFISSDKFEFRSFDTHGSEEEASELIEHLKLLLKNKSVFALLAHDSAAKSLKQFSGRLTKMGFKVLGGLQSRQAYVMNNFEGSISETANDLSISKELSVPKIANESGNIFPKTKYDYDYSNDRFIAHAAGEINGVKSTNSLEALDSNYKKGFRLFELDIIETSDGKYVAAHDWKMWARFTDYKGNLPVTHSEFLRHKIYGKYTTMDMEAINKWFTAHPDAILITDKVSDPLSFAKQFVDKSRLIMELFSLMAVEEAAKNNIVAMISQNPLNKIAGDKVAYLTANNVKHVAISRRIIAAKTGLLKQLRQQGIKVYVYNVNFDPGKDEKYVLDNEIGLVYGMYADSWVFDREEQQ